MRVNKVAIKSKFELITAIQKKSPMNAPLNHSAFFNAKMHVMLPRRPPRGNQRPNAPNRQFVARHNRVAKNTAHNIELAASLAVSQSALLHKAVNKDAAVESGFFRFHVAKAIASGNCCWLSLLVKINWRVTSRAAVWFMFNATKSALGSHFVSASMISCWHIVAVPGD